MRKFGTDRQERAFIIYIYINLKDECESAEERQTMGDSATNSTGPSKGDPLNQHATNIVLFVILICVSGGLIGE